MTSATPTIIIASDRLAGALCPVCQRDSRVGEEVAVCQACSAVHHRRCWEASGHCGSYSCAPGRRESTSAASAIAISMTELSEAVPLPRRSPANLASDRWSVPPREEPRLSKLAVGAFITASLGMMICGLAMVVFLSGHVGTPLVFGYLTGMFLGLLALILGCTALSAMAGTRMKGAGWAVAALLFGLFEMVGSVVGMGVAFNGGLGQGMAAIDFQPDLTSLQGLPGPLNRAMRANVLIESTLGGVFKHSGIGSGVILEIANGEALIVTNRHVIDTEHHNPTPRNLDEINKSNIRVNMVGQQPEPARVVWVAPDGVDAALVRVHCESDEAQAAPWKAVTPMHVGDQVFAIGNPHNLGWTHTQGSISQFRTQGAGHAKIRVIQTQTAINPGNSGGGLYDQAGTLIGINTWTNDKRISEGISFAIAFESVVALDPTGLKVAAKDEAKPEEKPSEKPAAGPVENADQPPAEIPLSKPPVSRPAVPGDSSVAPPEGPSP